MTRQYLIMVASLFAMLPFSAMAQTPQFTLAPGQRTELRFDYGGDSSPITISFDSPGATGVELSIYTPAQLDAISRGETVNPIGRGTPQKNYALYWQGAFNQGGVYRVVIENKSGATFSYRLDISGDAVKGAAPVGTPTPPPTPFIAVDGKYRVLNLWLPPGSGATAIRLAVPDAPTACTHANQIPQPIRASTRLCQNESYPAMRITGNNIVLMGDESRTSVIASNGRQWALQIDGSNNWIENVTVQANADGLDRVAWLCQYDSCIFNTQPATTTVRGGLLYGGGVLLNGSNSLIRGVTVRGAMIGIATNNGRHNYILENQVSDSYGWGVFSMKSADSFYAANEFSRVNHGCSTPDGYKFDHGCETAGWVCLACSGNLVARNQCSGSANCYYMSGERGLASNSNRFVANYCTAATDNCFELTFSRDNIFQDNVSTVDPKTGQGCKYPYWIGGSIVYFKNNRWECDITASKALSDATASTPTQTLILDLDATNGPVPTPAK